MLHFPQMCQTQIFLRFVVEFDAHETALSFPPLFGAFCQAVTRHKQSHYVHRHLLLRQEN